MLSVLGVIPARLASTRLPRKVLRPLAGRPLVAWVYEAARKAPDLEDVVVATDADEVMQACRALCFSKYGIPFDRDNRGAVRYKHVGLYAYTRPALDAFHRLPPSVLERTEGLEQLRFLEHGIPITVMETTEATIGVDTEEDLRAAEARLTERR